MDKFTANELKSYISDHYSLDLSPVYKNSIFEITFFIPVYKLNKKVYNNFLKFLDKQHYKSKNCRVSISYDVSGYEYFKKEKDDNFISINIILFKHTINSTDLNKITNIIEKINSELIEILPIY